MKSSIFFCCLIILLGISPGHASSEKEIRLRYGFVPGQRLQMDITRRVATSSSGNDNVRSLDMVAVMEVEQAETSRIESRILFQQSTVSDRAWLSGLGLPNPGEPRRIHFSALGRHLAEDRTGQLNLLILLPEKPVAIGDTWTDTIRSASGDGFPELDMTYRFKLEKIGQSRSKRLALISYTMTGQDGGRTIQVRGKGKAVLNLNMDIPVKVEHEMTMDCRQKGVQFSVEVDGSVLYKPLESSNEFDEFLSL